MSEPPNTGKSKVMPMANEKERGVMSSLKQIAKRMSRKSLRNIDE